MRNTSAHAQWAYEYPGCKKRSYTRPYSFERHFFGSNEKLAECRAALCAKVGAAEWTNFLPRNRDAQEKCKVPHTPEVGDAQKR